MGKKTTTGKINSTKGDWNEIFYFQTEIKQYNFLNFCEVLLKYLSRIHYDNSLHLNRSVTNQVKKIRQRVASHVTCPPPPGLWFLGTVLGLGLETRNGCWKLVAGTSITSKFSIYTKINLTCDSNYLGLTSENQQTGNNSLASWAHLNSRKCQCCPDDMHHDFLELLHNESLTPLKHTR